MHAEKVMDVLHKLLQNASQLYGSSLLHNLISQTLRASSQAYTVCTSQPNALQVIYTVPIILASYRAGMLHKATERLN
jgi:hypothetical protein